jgi:hypothetical protein
MCKNKLHLRLYLPRSKGFGGYQLAESNHCETLEQSKLEELPEFVMPNTLRLVEPKIEDLVVGCSHWHPGGGSRDWLFKTLHFF